jgi:hypothetical protein
MIYSLDLMTRLTPISIRKQKQYENMSGFRENERNVTLDYQG